MNKIHPLFEKALVLFLNKDWTDAGKPVLAEEEKRVEWDDGRRAAAPCGHGFELAAKDARIKELEKQTELQRDLKHVYLDDSSDGHVAYISVDSHIARQDARIKGLEAKLDWADRRDEKIRNDALEEAAHALEETWVAGSASKVIRSLKR